MKFELKGSVVPVFTPFKSNGEVDLEVIPKYMQFLLKSSSIDGILVNGTSGEGMSLSPEERKATTEAWIKAANKKTHVMVQIGGTSLPTVIELAQHAYKNGADSLLCLPDLYMKPQTISELIDYLSFVSKAVPLPLLYYHIPMFTNVNLHMGEFLTKVGDSLPNFVGIKFTSNDLDEGLQALSAHGGKFAVFLGADKLLLPASTLGFQSCIATTLNFLPKNGKYLLDSNISLYDRKQKQEKLNNMINFITSSGSGWVSTMKCAMNVLTEIDCGKVRLPMKKVSEKTTEEFSKVLPKFVMQ